MEYSVVFKERSRDRNLNSNLPSKMNTVVSKIGLGGAKIQCASNEQCGTRLRMNRAKTKGSAEGVVRRRASADLPALEG